MTKDEALKKAFKQAFQLGQDYWYQADHEYLSQNKKSDVTRAKFEQLMEDAIKEALAQPEQEPCGGCGGSGWVSRDPDIGTDQECFVCEGAGVIKPQQEPDDLTIAYMAGLSRGKDLAPQRTWVGLTEEEIADCAEKMEASDPTDSFWREFFRGIEAKLKDKNT